GRGVPERVGVMPRGARRAPRERAPVSGAPIAASARVGPAFPSAGSATGPDPERVRIPVPPTPGSLRPCRPRSRVETTGLYFAAAPVRHGERRGIVCARPARAGPWAGRGSPLGFRAHGTCGGGYDDPVITPHRQPLLERGVQVHDRPVEHETGR